MGSAPGQMGLGELRSRAAELRRTLDELARVLASRPEALLWNDVLEKFGVAGVQAGALAADGNGAPGEGARFAREAQGWLDDAWKHEEERWYYFVSNWNNMAWNAQLLLARLTGAPPLLEATKGFLDGWRFGRVVNVTAGGLAYADDWGTLRNSANSALLALVYAKHVGKEKGAPYACWAQVREGGRERERERSFPPIFLCVWGRMRERKRKSSTHLFFFFFFFKKKKKKQSQLRYMLGDGARGWSRGKSFLVGHGKQFPQQPHQRAASCPPPPATCNYLQLHSKDPNPNVLVGALVGGPFFNDSFPDDRMDYAKSEVVREREFFFPVFFFRFFVFFFFGFRRQKEKTKYSPCHFFPLVKK